MAAAAALFVLQPLFVVKAREESERREGLTRDVADFPLRENDM